MTTPRFAAALATVVATVTPAQEPMGPAGFIGQTAVAPVQTGTPPRLGFDRVPIHTGEADLGHEYGIWAAGAGYKVSFHDAPTFVPYLGSAAPENLPVTWRTASVLAGGQPLMNHGEQPDRFHTDYRYEFRYDRFTEAYDVLREGLEQTFVIHSPPASAGDLVVVGRIETPMTAGAFVGQHRPIEFRGADGNVYVKYSEAFVFDASGRRAPIATSHESGTIVLTAPAAWLEDAVYPVTIDPLTTRVQVMGLNRVFETCGVTRDTHHDSVMVVFTMAASAADLDAYAVVDGDCRSTISRFAVWGDVTSSWDTPRIKNCCLEKRQHLIVVERRYNGTENLHRVRYHTRLGDDSRFSAQVNPINPPAGHHDWRPDCGGTEVRGTDNAINAIIVFQREATTVFENTQESRIVARIVDTSAGVGAATTISADIAVPARSSTGAPDQERPSVNSETETSQDYGWLCVWQEYDWRFHPYDDWDVVGRRIDRIGRVADTPWITSGDSNDKHQLGPRVEGWAGRYLVAYSQLEIEAAVKPDDVLGTGAFTERVDWTRRTGPVNYPIQTLWDDGYRKWHVGDPGFDKESRSHWVVPAISEVSSVGGTGYIYAHRCGFRGAPMDVAAVHIDTGRLDGSDAAVVFDNDSNFFHVIYVEHGIPSAIFGRCYSYETAPRWSTSGAGCSAVELAWVGPGDPIQDQQIGSEFTGIEASGAPTSASHFLILSLLRRDLPILHPLIEPGCRILVESAGPGFLGVLPVVTDDTVRWSLPLPEALPPVTLLFQNWHTNAAGLLESTHRLEVPLVK